MKAKLPSTLDDLKYASVPAVHISLWEHEWRECDFNDHLFFKESIFCPPDIRRSVIKRRREYFYGRLSARTAIRQFIPAFNGIIGSNEDRSPIWPSGIVGSISHCNNYAISVCGETKNILAAGVDAEAMIAANVAYDIAPSIVTDNELEIKDVRHWPFEKKLTLAFSAKESLYKALYPLEKKFFSFDSAEVLDIDSSQNCFLLRLTESLGKSWQKGSIIEGRFTIRAHSHMKNVIVTAIIIPT